MVIFNKIQKIYIYIYIFFFFFFFFRIIERNMYHKFIGLQLLLLLL